MNVTINTATVDTPLAAGQVLGDWAFEILDVSGNVVAHQTNTAPNCTITGVADGTYTAHAWRTDTAGNVFGAKMTSDPFVVATPAPEMGQSAGAVTVTVN